MSTLFPSNFDSSESTTPSRRISLWAPNDVVQRADGTQLCAHNDGIFQIGSDDALTEILGKPKSSKNLFARSLIEDAGGTLWCAAATGLWREGPDGFTKLTNKEGLASRETFDVALGSSGQLMVGCAGGLSEQQAEGWKNTAAGMLHKSVRCLAIGADGTAYCGGRYGLSAVKPDGTVLAWKKGSGLEQGSIRWIRSGQAGLCRVHALAVSGETLWILQGSSLYRMHGRERPVPVSAPEGEWSGVTSGEGGDVWLLSRIDEHDHLVVRVSGGVAAEGYRLSRRSGLRYGERLRWTADGTLWILGYNSVGLTAADREQ